MPVSGFNGIKNLRCHPLGLNFMLYSVLLNWYIFINSFQEKVCPYRKYVVCVIKQFNKVPRYRLKITDKLSLVKIFK